MTNSEINSERKSLQGKIERFKDKTAVIRLQDDQELSWPIKNLPEGAEVGSEVRLKLSTSEADHEEQEKIAKIILNKIFGN